MLQFFKKMQVLLKNIGFTRTPSFWLRFARFYGVKSAKNSVCGFTLIELMVTITIVVLVTAVVLVNYSSFNSSVLLTSQAYIMALDIREAQSLAISARGTGGEFREEYGMYFDTNTPNRYLLFKDNGSDEPALYDSGEEIGTPNTMDPRFEITAIGTDSSCTPDNISVTFRRPDFDAIFDTPDCGGTINEVDITVESVNGGDTKTILITSTGQISVD